MTVNRPAFEEVTGYLGVGSLELLGGFFVLDGMSGFLSFVETYAATNAWAIFVTIPALVVAYVLGIFSSLGAEALLDRVTKSVLKPSVFAFVISKNNEHLVLRYADTERHARLLYGCIPGFLLIAVGCLLEARLMGAFGFVGYIGFTLCLIAAFLCPILARHLQYQLVRFVDAVREHSENAPNNSFKPSPLSGR